MKLLSSKEYYELKKKAHFLEAIQLTYKHTFTDLDDVFDSMYEYHERQCRQYFDDAYLRGAKAGIKATVDIFVERGIMKKVTGEKLKARLFRIIDDTAESQGEEQHA